MATNNYFQAGKGIGTSNEQRLVEDLVIESLKVYGHDIFYLPRTLTNKSTIFDEDQLSQFTQAYPIEMYLENINGFEGQGDIFTRFGLEVRDQATFVMAKRRWDDLTFSSPGTFTQTARPRERALLYFPLTKSLFEIKLVEFQNPFFQLNKIYVYRLQCELFEYSSEDIRTGIAEIDGIEEKYSQDMLEYQLQLENGNLLLKEDGGSLIKENYSTNIEPIDNIDFDNLFTLELILYFI